jgi:hypothetical protein
MKRGELNNLSALWLGFESRDSSVGIATGYEFDDREVGVRLSVRSRIFTSPSRLHRPWGLPGLLSNGFLGFFSGGKAVGA